MARGKKYVKVVKNINKGPFPLEKAIAEAKKNSYSTFNGTIELSISLKLPKDTDPKSIKGSLVLPHPVKKDAVKIAVLTTADKQKEAAAAGADMSDFAQISADIKAGKIEFDILIATPDIMSQIAVLGKQLGPRGLMPNPKMGTVTDDLTKTIGEYKKGKLTFSASDTGVVQFGVGKVDMDNEKIIENVVAAAIAASSAINKKPAQAVKIAHITPTMGPSVKVELGIE